MKKAFVSWSGGKDCCQAAYKAAQQGFELKWLLNMVNQEAGRSCSHGIPAKWVSLQADALGIPILQPATRGEDYEEVFTATLRQLKQEGITHGVFGDMDFEPHREWVERVCGAAGIIPVLPLWQGAQEQIALDFIKAGFVSVITTVRADLLGEEWLGRTFDEGFLREIEELNRGITPCGEAGEFHTLVIDGPLFKKRLEIRFAEKVRRQDHLFLDIRSMELVESQYRGVVR